MNIWHMTPDAPRWPHRVSPGEAVHLHIGTWSIEPGQSVWVTTYTEHADGTSATGRAEATWQYNAGVNSYWRAEIGPFAKGDRVTYTIYSRSPDSETRGPPPS